MSHRSVQIGGEGDFLIRYIGRNPDQGLRIGAIGIEFIDSWIAVDPYLRQKFFKDITDPVLLEIRRERQVELALEGFRFNDLKRWKQGHIMAELEWSGIYIPALDQPMDLDRDGTIDVIFYDGNNKGPSVSVDPKVAKIAIGGPATNYQTMTGDKHLEWFKAQPRTWYTDGRQYYYPIPANAMVLNKNLKNYIFWQ